MRGPLMKTAFGVVTAAAVAVVGLAPGVASAATAAPGAVAYSAAGPAAPDTTVTFAVTTGALTMTAPATADLGSGAPGTTITGNLGPVTVTDDRALLAASWVTTAVSTAWTTGAGTPAETIPATDVGYDPGAITTTGTITATGTPLTTLATAAPVVTGTEGVGNNTASWNPAISVRVPASAVGGSYTGTLTESVS